VALFRTLGVDGVDGWEMVVPVAQGEKASDARLIVAEEDESWKDDGQELRHAQALAGETHSGGCRVFFGSQALKWMMLR
jgi:hypothetical protein